MAVASSTDKIREELRELGQQRKSLDKKDEQLTTKIKRALAKADGKLSVTEQAELLKLHRTTLYRVYLD